MAKFTHFPCPDGSCNYIAYSQVALDEHTVQVHGGSVAPPAPSSSSVPSVADTVVDDARIMREEARRVADKMMADTQDLIQASTHHKALFVPPVDDTFWVEDLALKLLVAIEQRAVNGENINIFLTGPTGAGKSSLPEQFAALNKRLCFVQHCELVVEAGDWWGQKEMDIERGTYFEKAAFVTAIQTPGAVVIMDEVNRTHPDNLNPLFGLLDHRRRAWVPVMNDEIKVAEGVTFWFTLNMGFDYQVNPVDLALLNRAQVTIPMRYPPKAWEINLLKEKGGVGEDTAEKLAEFARTVRNNPRLHVAISPRQLIEAATLVRYGVPIHDSVMVSTINGASEDMDKTALLQALQTVGPVDAAYVEDTNED